jgi:hypothetical protein
MCSELDSSSESESSFHDTSDFESFLADNFSDSSSSTDSAELPSADPESKFFSKRCYQAQELAKYAKWLVKRKSTGEHERRLFEHLLTRQDDHILLQYVLRVFVRTSNSFKPNMHRLFHFPITLDSLEFQMEDSRYIREALLEASKTMQSNECRINRVAIVIDGQFWVPEELVQFVKQASPAILEVKTGDIPVCERDRSMRHLSNLIEASSGLETAQFTTMMGLDQWSAGKLHDRLKFEVCMTILA